MNIILMLIVIIWLIIWTKICLDESELLLSLDNGLRMFVMIIFLIGSPYFAIDFILHRFRDP